MNEPLLLPVVPLRDSVLFPGVNLPIGAGRPGTLRAIEAALAQPGKRVFAVAQRKNLDHVSAEGLSDVGTVATLAQVQRSLNGMQLVLQGERRGTAVRYLEQHGYLAAVTLEAGEQAPLDADDPAFVALYREARERAAELARRAGLPEEGVQRVLAGIDDPGRFADFVAAYVEISTEERQALLEILSVEDRLRRVLVAVERQITVLEAQEEIKSKVREELGDRQREMLLREQLKAIQKELGEADDATDLDELALRLEKLELPEVARKEVNRELGRMKRMGRESMEAQVVRTFLETVADLPWNKRSVEHLDIQEAAKILDEDHFGLTEVKDRVLEFLAVRQLGLEAEAAEAARQASGEAAGEGATAVAPGEESTASPAAPVSEAATSAHQAGEAKPDGNEAGHPQEAPAKERPKAGREEGRAKGPILLFVGPPGVGKTSVARSIARAMGREYVRISLGGARDEADIRGHRRTYVGAMPGRILQGMKQAGAKNPVFLLDEIDKLGVSFQGDPAAALLEVLDPAQNDSFTDHYLGVPFDLSEVLFIATANYLQNIPPPLLDRMETVEFRGYTENEKLAIAERYLVPRQLAENNLTDEQVVIGPAALSELVAGYTREAGVRQLEREIGRVCRKAARKIAAHEVDKLAIGAETVRELLGRAKVHPEKAARSDQIGVATGMFYTPTGGDILFVEALTMKGKGELVLTGQLGDVMKESARAAWSYARAHAVELGIEDEAFSRDLHIHVPAGAIPKDGPSAGVTMATAVVSALANRPVRCDLAMTGEVTLSGRVLPIGGLKEKILGAVRAGITDIVLPKDNEPDLEDLPPEARERITTHPVEELGQVLAFALRGASFREGRLLFGSETPRNSGHGPELRH